MMVGRMRIVSVALIVATLSIMTGCAPSAAPKVVGLVTVSGVVTLDGKPLPNATVTFVPTGGAAGGELSAGGLSDSTGKYILRTGDKNYGIKPGQYKVIISSIVMADGSVKQIGADVSPMQLMIEGGKEVVPPKYSDLLNTTLTSNVAPEGGNIDFTLTST